MIHAIDTYIYDKDSVHVNGQKLTRNRIKKYLEFADRPDLGFKMVDTPQIDENVCFSCRYASNSDNELYRWNTIAPAMISHREEGQSVSIKAEWIRT